MADLLVRGVEESLVRALISALLSPPRRKLADLLAAMPDVGRDADFERQSETAADTDVFD
jgi:hypothetical protein